MSALPYHVFLSAPIRRRAIQLGVLCLIVYGFTQPLKAQITITNSVFPAVGDTLHYAFGNQAGAINQIFTPPGGNQVWNLSNLQATQTWDQVMQNPASGTAHASFPGATLLYTPPNSASEVYWQISGAQVLNLGYFGLDPLDLGLNLLFVNSGGLEESWAPVNFFEIHQSTTNVLTAFSASLAPAPLITLAPTADSFRIRITYQRLGVIDAYGALSIPGGTFDVLRKKQTEYKSTAIDVKVAPLGWIDISTIGGQQVFPLGTDTITSFHFLNDVSKEEIAICTLNTQQNQVVGVQYKVIQPATAVFTPAVDKIMHVYPNPVLNTLHLRLNSDVKSAFQLRLININGSSVLNQTVAPSPADRDISIPVDRLAPGIYEVILERDGVIAGTGRVVKM